MKPTKTPAPAPNNVVAQVTSALALALMQRALEKGNPIEIPSLGIRIEPQPPADPPTQQGDR